MKFFRREKAAPAPKVPDADTLAAVHVLREFRELAASLGVSATYIDVSADFGSLLERRGADVLPTPDAQLPHPKELIWRALMVTIAMHPSQREYAKAAAVVHLQQYVSTEMLAPYGAAVEAARAFMRSIHAGPQQGLEAARYVGDALERIGPLQRQIHRATRQAEFDVSRRFSTFWDGPDYFFWRYTHLSDLLGAAAEAAEAVEAIHAIRNGDAPEGRGEQTMPQWQAYQARLTEIAHLSEESKAPLATRTPQDAERHETYRDLLMRLFVAVAQLGAGADDDVRTVGGENYRTISEALGKINEQEQQAITAAFTSRMTKPSGSVS
jgi:hypothetical protein